MILTIDAGNTRTKWAVFDDANAVAASGAMLSAALDSTPAEWAQCALAVVSNVAGDNAALQIKTLLDAAGKTGKPLEQIWVASRPSGFGIRNAYEKPQLLGCDRWAAMIGARQYCQQNCLVVNAGTALTIDALQYDEATDMHHFPGGVIVPGLQLMLQSVTLGTRNIGQLLDQAAAGVDAGFPRRTEDAIYSGALLAMAGAVGQMSMRLQRKTGASVRCIIAGGDAALLADKLQGSAAISDIVVMEDLVLRGLLVIGRETLKGRGTR